MKALLKQQARPGLWLEDLPEPEVGVNDVLIKVLRTAVCGRCRNCLAGGAMAPAKWYLTGTNRGT